MIRCRPINPTRKQAKWGLHPINPFNTINHSKNHSKTSWPKSQGALKVNRPRESFAWSTTLPTTKVKATATQAKWGLSPFNPINPFNPFNPINPFNLTRTTKVTATQAKWGLSPNTINPLNPINPFNLNKINPSRTTTVKATRRRQAKWVLNKINPSRTTSVKATRRRQAKWGLNKINPSRTTKLG